MAFEARPSPAAMTAGTPTVLLQLAAGREKVMTSENTTLAGSLLTRPACLIYPEPGLEPTLITSALRPRLDRHAQQPPHACVFPHDRRSGDVVEYSISGLAQKLNIQQRPRLPDREEKHPYGVSSARGRSNRNSGQLGMGVGSSPGSG